MVLTIVIRKIANCTFTTCSKMQWSASNRKIATNHHFRICCQIYIFSKYPYSPIGKKWHVPGGWIYPIISASKIIDIFLASVHLWNNNVCTIKHAAQSNYLVSSHHYKVIFQFGGRMRPNCSAYLSFSDETPITSA